MWIRKELPKTGQSGTPLSMRLLLADDHGLFRDALVHYIKRASPGADVSVARDFYEAQDILEEKPDMDLVLLDLKMPGMHGLEGLKRIRSKYPEMPVALMSGLAEEADVREAIELGVAGYFPKTLSGSDLIQAIQLVLSGEKFFPMEKETGKFVPAYYGDKKETAVPSVKGPSYGVIPSAERSSGSAVIIGPDVKQALTPREYDVLQSLAKGASNKEIARDLDLQEVTVKLHIRGLCRKLGAANRTQVALRAYKLGLTQ